MELENRETIEFARYTTSIATSPGIVIFERGAQERN